MQIGAPSGVSGGALLFLPKRLQVAFNPANQTGILSKAWKQTPLKIA